MSLRFRSLLYIAALLCGSLWSTLTTPYHPYGAPVPRLPVRAEVQP